MNKYTEYKNELMLIVIIIIMTISTTLQANNFNNNLKNAENLYNKGNYKEAIEEYKKIINAGYTAPEMLYNIANAYYKQKEYHAAILFYEKAKKLSPNDQDIQHNLELASLQTRDKFESIPPLFFIEWINQFSNLMYFDQWAKVFIAFFIIFFITIATYLLAKTTTLKKTFFLASIIALIISITALSTAIYQHNKLNNTQFAIIFTPSITVKSSPDNNSTDLFLLHEGTKVELLDKIGKWYKIRISNGSIGWLEEHRIEKI